MATLLETYVDSLVRDRFGQKAQRLGPVEVMDSYYRCLVDCDGTRTGFSVMYEPADPYALHKRIQ